MVTEGVKNYTYDTFGNLASVGNSSSAQYTRIYDSAMNPMTHIDSVNNMRYNYEYEGIGRPVLATKRDLVAKKNYQYYLITNTRGDVIETRNGDGNVNAKFVYDAWGKLIAVTNASGTPLASDSFAYQISLKYRGYVYDNETGLYYLQSRYYDPETGRFLNADDVDYIGASGTVLGYNAFAYCENNAVNDSDTNGTISYHKIIKLIVNSFLLIVKLIVVLYRFIEAHFYRDRCNRIIYISSFFLSTAIDALIALATNSLMYRGLKNILRLILENKIIRGKFINWVFNFLLYKKIGKGLLWLLYRLGLLIAGKEGVIGVAIKSAFQDWLLNILSFKNDVLKRATAFIMSFSSIGGMIALIMDFGDGYYDDWVVINY